MTGYAGLPLCVVLPCIALQLPPSAHACKGSHAGFSHVRGGGAQARPLLARALSEEGNFDELLDPRLENRINRLELERMCASAAAAVRHSAKRRPKMKQVSFSFGFLNFAFETPSPAK